MKNEKNTTPFRSHLAAGIPKRIGRMALALVTAGALLGPPSSALHAEVVISNLPNTVTGGSTVSDITWKAMLFTTGSSPTQFASVVVGLNPPTGATPPITPNVKVSIFSVSEGVPAAELTTSGLVAVDMQATQGLYTFFDDNPFSLAASTSYALVLSSDTSEIKWGRNQNATPTVSNGFQYDTFLQTLDSGGTWSTPASLDNAVEINVVPEPSILLLIGMGIVIGLRIFRGTNRASWLQEQG
ncbi:MAG: choice-of-anchor R domain-containing protein [Kiritimatiellia bacterium]